MPIDPQGSTVNTSGGLRASLEFLRNQAGFCIPDITVNELEQRAVVTLNKADFVEAVTLLLSGTTDAVRNLVAALEVPTIAAIAGNALKKNANNEWYVELPEVAKTKRIVRTSSSSGTDLSFTWSDDPFSNSDYSFNLYAISDPGAAWSYSVVNRTTSSISFLVYGLTQATSFQLIATL